MPLDAATIAALSRELSDRIVGLRIDKVFQPEKDEIVLSLRGIPSRAVSSSYDNCRLFISANQQGARVHITDRQRENPQAPPMFCMLLRKHLTGSLITAVTQPPLERMLEISIDSTDEMGEIRHRKLVIELIGRQSNLLLIEQDERIIDALRRVDGDITTGKRQLLPGMFYRAPDPQDKTNPLACGGDERRRILSLAQNNQQIAAWIQENFFGLSPLICREIAFRCGGDVSARVSEVDAEAIAGEFENVLSIMENGAKPFILRDRNDKNIDFSFLKITQYEGLYTVELQSDFSEMLEEFYFSRESHGKLRGRSSDMIKNISSSLERLRRKIETQKVEYAASLNREPLRRTGDLLMANIHNMRRGQSLVKLENFYEPDSPEIEISLSPKLSPQENAAKYYKDYTRMKNAEKILSDLIAAGERESEYLQSVLLELDRVENIRDIQEIREELEQSGFIKKTFGKNKKQTAQPPREFLSTGGFTILAGRNNLQNDMLTLKTAHNNDIWMHAQKAPGSHIIIKCQNEEPDDDTYTQAAQISAYYSEYRGGQNVAVDYTRVRFVKKPAGANPGMVIYDPYYTAYVTPDEELIKTLRTDQ